jgi:hypothetical protein
MTTFF